VLSRYQVRYQVRAHRNDSVVVMVYHNDSSSSYQAENEELKTAHHSRQTVCRIAVDFSQLQSTNTHIKQPHACL